MALQEFSGKDQRHLDEKLTAWQLDHPGVPYVRQPVDEKISMQPSYRPYRQNQFPDSVFLVIEYEIPDQKIYVEAGQRATLLFGSRRLDCHTLQEAVIAWHKLPDEQKDKATIRTDSGLHYTEKEIGRLHYG